MKKNVVISTIVTRYIYIKVILNTVFYPYHNLNLDTEKNNFTLLFNMYTTFQELYNEKVGRNPMLSPSTFKSTSPIFVVNASKQSDESTASTVDKSVEIDALEKHIRVALLEAPSYV